MGYYSCNQTGIKNLWVTDDSQLKVSKRKEAAAFKQEWKKSAMNQQIFLLKCPDIILPFRAIFYFKIKNTRPHAIMIMTSPHVARKSMLHWDQKKKHLNFWETQCSAGSDPEIPEGSMEKSLTDVFVLRWDYFREAHTAFFVFLTHAQLCTAYSFLMLELVFQTGNVVTAVCLVSSQHKSTRACLYNLLYSREFCFSVVLKKVKTAQMQNYSVPTDDPSSQDSDTIGSLSVTLKWCLCIIGNNTQYCFHVLTFKLCADFKQSPAVLHQTTRSWNINVYLGVSVLCRMNVSLSSAPLYSFGEISFQPPEQKGQPRAASLSQQPTGPFPPPLRTLGSFVYRTLDTIGENQSAAPLESLLPLLQGSIKMIGAGILNMLLLHVSPCGCVTQLWRHACWSRSLI